jgi:hypothetical protein
MENLKTVIMYISSCKRDTSTYDVKLHFPWLMTTKYLICDRWFAPLCPNPGSTPGHHQTQVEYARPYYRIYSRTIKRGSWLSSLNISCIECSNFACVQRRFYFILCGRLCNDLSIVSRYKMIPSSSKSESIWGSHHVFCVPGFAGPRKNQTRTRSRLESYYPV